MLEMCFGPDVYDAKDPMQGVNLWSVMALHEQLYSQDYDAHKATEKDVCSPRKYPMSEQWKYVTLW